MKSRFLFLLSFFLILNLAKAQDKEFKQLDLGVGFGINYGGIGFSLAYAPIPFVSVEGFCGYNLAHPNAGGALNLHLIPKNSSKVYSMAFKAIYGYNAVIVIKEGNMPSKSFYGLSVGLSNQFRFGRNKRRGFNVDLILPLRSDEVEGYIDELKYNGYETSELTPIMLSIGYHVEI